MRPPNDVRLHSAIGYVTPKDRLEGRHKEIYAARDRKLAEARECRRQLRQTQHERQQCQPDVTGRPAIDFTAVRAAITITQVLELLSFVPQTHFAGQQRGPCPLHGSTHGTSRCFSANTNAHTFHCFKWSRNSGRRPLACCFTALLTSGRVR